MCLKLEVNNVRTFKVADEIQKVVATVLLKDIQNPHLKFVTVSSVNVTKDLGYADIYVTSLNDKADKERIEKALNSASGVFKRQLNKSLKMRKLPDLRFHFDEVFYQAREMEDILVGLDIPSDAHTSSNLESQSSSEASSESNHS